MHLCLIEFHFIAVLAINSMCKAFLEGLGGLGDGFCSFWGFLGGFLGEGWGMVSLGGVDFCLFVSV